MNPRTAIPTLARIERRPHREADRPIALCIRRFRPVRPRVVAAGRDAQRRFGQIEIAGDGADALAFIEYEPDRLGLGVACSMSRRRNCYDNAVMEAFFSSVKSETADRFDSFGETKMQLFDYIEVFYNQRRGHSTLGYVSSAAYERIDHRRQAGGLNAKSGFDHLDRHP